MTKVLTSIELKNGIMIDFFDHSNRYYGDFHRVNIEAIASFPVDAAQLPNDLQDIALECGNSTTYTASLEKMGVKTADVERVSGELIDNFVCTVGRYLEKDNFIESLLRKKVES